MSNALALLKDIANTGAGWEQYVATQLVASHSSDEESGTTDPFAGTAVERLVQQGVVDPEDLEDTTALALRLADLYEKLASQFDPSGVPVSTLDEAAVRLRVPYYVEKFKSTPMVEVRFNSPLVFQGYDRVEAAAAARALLQIAPQGPALWHQVAAGEVTDV